ncbi:MAG: branched-chain amino acid ABC transporter ATP-binding protein/permease [Vulcanimicrobiaceae bacterium]
MTGPRIIQGAVVLAVVLLLVGPFVLFTTGYSLDVARLAFYLAAITITWSLLAGSAGQFSFAQIAIAVLGAYAGAIWSIALRPTSPLLSSVYVAVIVAIVFSTGLGLGLALLLSRLRGAYLALFTIAFAEIGRRVVVAEYNLTGGRESLAVPQWPGDAAGHYYIVLAAMLGVALAVWLVLRSHFGLFFRAMREDYDAAAALGVDVVRLKVFAFVVTSLLVGIASSAYFYTNTRIAPEDLDLFVMTQVIAFAVIGGIENPLAGGATAVVLVLVLESLRRITIQLPGLPPTTIEPGVWRLALFAAILTLAVRFARNGVIAPLAERLGGRGMMVRRAAQVRLDETAGEPRRAQSVPFPAAEPATSAQRERGVTLCIDGLRAGFRANPVLRGVDLTLDRPQICGVIGPNGAGKSTLVNVVCGVYAPQGGAILAHGERIDGLAPYEIARRGIGRTFQVTRPLGRMTVMENLLVPLYASPSRGRRAAMERRARALLEWLGLSHLEHEYARALSGGQQKLLELARLVMRDPEIFFLDEPFAGVHPNLRALICDFVVHLRNEGRAIVIIEHDIETLFALCDRLVVLAEGRIIADGRPEVVRQDSAVIAAYLGLPERPAAAEPTAPGPQNA